MKYKVGDTVRIKSIDWYNKNRNSLGRVKGFMPEMYEYLGKEAIIVKCYECSYELNIDHHFWNWDDEMFDETFKDNKMERKKGFFKVILPKDCELGEVNASLGDGCIIVEYTSKEKFVPKNGDVVYLESDSGTSWISIYKSKNNKPYDDSLWDYCSINIKNKDLNQVPSWVPESSISEIRLATEEEKKLLFDALEKEGLRWNAEERKMEQIRWRAKHGCTYYYVDFKSEAQRTADQRESADDTLYNIGNYFKTEEETQKYADKIKELLKNR